MQTAPPRPVTDRWGEETCRALWLEAIAAAPDYILITSWNEWHEGSELEPSVEYGSRILDDTAAFSRQFLAGQR
jgi:glycoprotein endo-alpha-1,2-mannosidase